MKATSLIRRSVELGSAFAVLVLAARATAQEAPQRRETPASFAAAGAPKEEDAPPRGGPFRKGRWTLEGHLGFGTPVGAAGLMLDYSILPELSVAAGGGVGSGPTNHIFHGAIAARVRPAVRPGDHDTMVLEAAFSTGGYQRFESGPLIPPVDGPGTPTPIGPSAAWAHFLQFEAAWEHRSDSGLLIRLGGGLATMLNPGALQCPSSPDECAPLHENGVELVAVLDFALGASF